jgi:hypothetical protein
MRSSNRCFHGDTRRRDAEAAPLHWFSASF